MHWKINVRKIFMLNINHKILLGVFLMVLAMALFSLKDAFVKMIDGYYPAVVFMWAQMAFSSIIYIPIIFFKYGLRSFFPKNPILQVLRALCVIIGMSMFYWAVSIIPLAEATAIAFVAPLVTTALSPLMLGEQVGIRRWSSVVVGFCGVLIILRPDLGGDRLGYIVAFGAGVAIGVFYIFNRLLAGKEPPLRNLMYSSTIALLLLTPVIFPVWVPPRQEDFFLILGFCAIAAVGQLCLFNAFVLGEASILAPITLSQIIFATGFGYLFFNDFPDSISIFGIIVVIISAAYIAFRETRPG